MAEEEALLLRLEDPQLAQTLRDALRSSSDTGSKPTLQLRFEDPQTPKQGQLILDGKSHAVFLKSLPAVVECFNTLDDVNLVKITDIGEVLVVPTDPLSMPQGDEWLHGVTPPMSYARARHFHKRIPADPHTVSRVEADILAIASGKAPVGTEYVDVEEEYVVDEEGGGSWQPLAKTERGAETLQLQKKKKAKKDKEKEKDAEADEALYAAQEKAQGQGHREEI